MSETSTPETVGPSIHPRILARMKLVALARRQEVLITELDELIVRLDHLGQFTNQFSLQVEVARELREQVAFVKVGSADNLVLIDLIKDHLADVKAALVQTDDGELLSLEQRGVGD